MAISGDVKNNNIGQPAQPSRGNGSDNSVASQTKFAASTSAKQIALTSSPENSRTASANQSSSSSKSSKSDSNSVLANASSTFQETEKTILSKNNRQEKDDQNGNRGSSNVENTSGMSKAEMRSLDLANDRVAAAAMIRYRTGVSLEQAMKIVNQNKERLKEFFYIVTRMPDRTKRMLYMARTRQNPNVRRVNEMFPPIHAV